jgi:single-strand DNA-binding protein
MISATITGRLGQDAEVKHLQDGTAILELNIASSSAKKDGPTTWVRASMFGERGAKLAQYLHKGDRIAASGTLELREWTSNTTGKSGTTLEMRVDQVDLIQDRRDGDQPAASTSTSNGRPAAAAAARPGSRVPF